MSTAELTRRRVLVSLALLFAMWLTGQIVRDAHWSLALLFYIPSPVMLILLILSAACSVRKKWKRMTIIMLLLCIAPAAFILTVENKWSSAACACKPDLSIVHWNVFGGNMGWERIAGALRSQGADLYALSEVPKDVEKEAIAAKISPGMSSCRISNMLVIGKGKIEKGERYSFGKGKAYPVSWQHMGGSIKLLVVDLPSSIFIARAPLLAWVRQIIAEQAPDIVIGDFNAPRLSRGLSNLPDGYAHAYEAVGNGWSYTWPVPLPVYAIDQCIIGPRIHATGYELHTSIASDHRMQILNATLRAQYPHPAKVSVD